MGFLSSTAKDHLQKRCRNLPNTAVVYWYFTFTDTEKQKLDNFVCSIIKDICSNRRVTPAALQQAYDNCNRGQQKPTLATLKSLLQVVLSGFDDVFLVIDALDECPRSGFRRQELLDCLRDVRCFEESSLHILATSRKEADIEESYSSELSSIGSFFSMKISAQGDHVEQRHKKISASSPQGPPV